MSQPPPPGPTASGLPSYPPASPVPLYQQQFQPMASASASPSSSYSSGSKIHLPSTNRPSKGGLPVPFNSQGGYRAPDSSSRNRPRATGGAMAGTSGGSGYLSQRNSLSHSPYESAGYVENPYGGHGGYPAQGQVGGGGWYSSAQPGSANGLRYSNDRSSSGESSLPTSSYASPSNSTSTNTSPAASLQMSFPYTPYGSNPYVSSLSSQGYYVPPGMLYASAPQSAVDPSSQPSSPAPASSGGASSHSPQTFQSPDGQAWVYLPVQMPGYYGQPGAHPYPGPPSSDGSSFSSQGGQGPPSMYNPSMSANLPYSGPPPSLHYQSPPPLAYNYHAHPTSSPSSQTFAQGRSRPSNASQFSGPSSPYPSAAGGRPPFYGQQPSRPVASPGLSSQPPTPQLASLRIGGSCKTPDPTRKAWHPAAPAQRSEFVMWCGNVPSDASQDELWTFFTGAPQPKMVDESSSAKAPVTASVMEAEASVVDPTSTSKDADDQAATTEERDVASIFLIARSSCCFVNYQTKDALEASIERFNGVPMRPQEGPRAAKLVCRVRRKEDDLKAGVGAQRGRGVHRDWVKEKQAQAAAQFASLSAEGEAGSVGENGEKKEAGEATPAAAGSVKTPQSAQSYRGSTISSQASTDSSFLARYFPCRYFILKSLTQADLDTSLKTGLWATQAHNEGVLGQAYRNSKEVILIFGANKTGEFFGYAKMAGPIKKGVSRLSWASRSSGQSGSPLGSTSALSPTSATHAPQHQRSAPDVIIEGNEDDNSDPSRAHTHPTSKTAAIDFLPHAQASLKQRASVLHQPQLQESPGEITSGVPKASSTTPNDGQARDVDEIDRAQTPRNSAPGGLETHGQDQSPLAILAHGATDPPELGRALTEQETADIIEQVGRASAQGSASAGNSPPTPPRLGQQVPFHAELPPLDQDGIRRLDHAPKVSSTGERMAGSSGSAPSLQSFTGSSAGQSSTSRSFPFPNTHLPVSPDPNGIASDPLDRVANTDASNATPGDGETWGTPFSVEWLQTKRLPFSKVRNLRNPWNQNREVKVSRDGTEIEPDVGRQLIALWASPSSPSLASRSPSAGSVPLASTTVAFYAGLQDNKQVSSPAGVLGLGFSAAPQSSAAA